MLLVVLYIAESSFRADLRDIAIWLLYYSSAMFWSEVYEVTGIAVLLSWLLLLNWSLQYHSKE